MTGHVRSMLDEIRMGVRARLVASGQPMAISDDEDVVCAGCRHLRLDAARAFEIVMRLRREAGQQVPLRRRRAG